jgi:hypothetical protein
MAAVLIPLAGCGYRFSGGGLPPEIRTVFVETFVNRTRDVSVAEELTSAIKSEFHRRGGVRLVDRPGEADAVLSGVIRSLVTRVVSVNRKDEALQFETALVADLSLRRRASGELVWRTENARLAEVHAGARGAVVTTSPEFKSGTLNASNLRAFSDIQLAETLSREARQDVLAKFGRNLHQRLMEMF